MSDICPACNYQMSDICPACSFLFLLYPFKGSSLFLALSILRKQGILISTLQNADLFPANFVLQILPENLRKENWQAGRMAAKLHSADRLCRLFHGIISYQLLHGLETVCIHLRMVSGRTLLLIKSNRLSCRILFNR